MLYIFSYQSSSLNKTSLLRFGKKAIFSYFINYCYFRYDSHVALFFHLLTNFTKDLPIDRRRPHPHPRSSILLSKMLQYFIKCSFLGDRNIRWPKWLRSTCILSVNCTQNWELPVALSVTWQTCGDVKIKHEERVHNRVISSWTRVGDGVKKSIKKNQWHIHLQNIYWGSIF